MNPPFHLDADILTIFSGDGTVVCSAYEYVRDDSRVSKLRRAYELDLRRIVACLNFTQNVSAEGMLAHGPLDLADLLALDLRRIVASLNFTQNVSAEGMLAHGPLDLARLALSANAPAPPNNVVDFPPRHPAADNSKE